MSRLLVVDDSPFVVEELSRIAEEGGFTVCGRAGNGAAALELADRLRPDLVSLDVDMPVLNGLATLKQLMTRRPVPVVMVSALTSDESPITFECLRLGALDYLEKPSGREGRDLALQRREILDRLKGAADVDRRTLRTARMRQPLPPPPRGRRERLDGLLVVSGGRGSLASVLRVLNAFPAATGAAAILLLDVRPQVAAAFASYASRFSAIRVEAPPTDTVLVPDVAYVVSTQSPALVLPDADGTWLRPFAPPAQADPALAATYLYTSAVDRFGSRVAGVVLAGAPRGTRDGLWAVRMAGGAVLGPDPRTAADAAALTALLADGCYVPSPGLDSLGAETAAALRTAGARR